MLRFMMVGRQCQRVSKYYACQF